MHNETARRLTIESINGSLSTDVIGVENASGNLGSKNGISKTMLENG